MSKSKDKNKQTADAVPKAVVSRLSLYLRELQRLQRDGVVTTSSTQLGQLLGFTDAQVRKDLAHFGHFGYPGVGYRCSELVSAVKQIIGTDHTWPVVLAGVGNLGRALLGHRGFGNQGFDIVAAVDSDPLKHGKTLDGIEIRPISQLPEIVLEHDVRLAIIAAPAAAAQEVAERIVSAGICGILNFAPITLHLPANVAVSSVDLAIEMEQLSFAMTNLRPPEDLLSNEGPVVD
ncbi:redox-sensing transcriptional repressor Rex [Blastopirellula sp. J2-11]|uniref:redox-sensing transcriptional repressor Rex n=1 Tax=Blastopirellula sp. J2-11 TaxID=2943192 RepID=UPI0021C9D498|nr:redox-sensing transcriptional repressor Rex [Blastopirellula sp. J2-11]UUO05657.1 redox-sensing transcriptional repressor Rex [Blastopirellula sp. J2-11]